jgi:hypothetical protein
MTTLLRYILASLLFAALLCTLWATAHAQPVDQPCGKGGTALRVGQGQVSLTDEEATAQQVRIRADGHWWTCESPALMPPPREPAPCLLGRGPVEYLTWQVGPHRCVTDRAVHTGIAHGETRELRAIWGATTGQIRYHCLDGQARVIGDPACAPAAQQCIGYVRWTIDGRVYSYDGNSQPVPVGRTATARAPDGSTITLRCGPGRRWSR